MKNEINELLSIVVVSQASFGAVDIVACMTGRSSQQ